MDCADPLIVALSAGLAPFGYVEQCRELSTANLHAVVLATPRTRTVRKVCAVVTLPDSCATPEQLRASVKETRRALSRAYARFPYWKEIGTFLVLMGAPGLQEAMRDSLPLLVDRTGAHVNIVLGAILVDARRRRCLAHSTWGLFFTGEHFRVIEAVTQGWLASSPS